MVIGEFPSPEEMYQQLPFSGTAGWMFRQLMKEAGIDESRCFYTNLLTETPPRGIKPGDGPSIEGLFVNHKKRLPGPVIELGIARIIKEIEATNPTLIIAAGDTALWALTGMVGITKWRGSELTTLPAFGSRKVIPTFAPGKLIRAISDKPAVQADLRRAERESHTTGYVPSERNFLVRPTFLQVMEWLDWADKNHRRWSIDIETRAYQISCVGIAVSKTQALCIPLMDSKAANGCYWAFEEELIIRQRLRETFLAPDREIIGQNFDYDSQMFVARMGFLPLVTWDTMIMHHVLFCELPKSLHFLSSLYCEHHLYWKDDGKEWNPNLPEEQHWTYNCEDCVRTYELADHIGDMLRDKGMLEVYLYRVKRIFPLLIRMMLRGIRVDLARKQALHDQLEEFRARMLAEIETVLGHPLNPSSPKKMKELFYNDFAQRPIIDRKTGNPTCNDDALTTIAKRTPMLAALIGRINDYRSAATLQGNAVDMELDEDHRARTQFKITGTVSYRLSSAANVFGSGGNLQNISKGEEDDDPEVIARTAAGRLLKPNLKEMYVPDPGYTIAECDLNRADLMVLVWEADDDKLRQLMDSGADLHIANACAAFGLRPEQVTELIRQRAKVGVHATHYGSGARSLAGNLGISTAEAQRFQDNWFREHPGIKEYQERAEAQLRGRRTIYNRFGYRRVFFDHVDSARGEAFIWLPQSTVAEVITRGMVQLESAVREVQILLQIHDSVVFQYPTKLESQLLPSVREALRVTVPYPKPLEIPLSLATSAESWGKLRKRKGEFGFA